MEGFLIFVAIVAASAGFMALFLRKPWNIREQGSLGGDEGSVGGPVRRKGGDSDGAADFAGGDFGGGGD